MKNIANYLFIALLLFALPACSKDDEPKHIDSEAISGFWYLTNIRGWERDSDSPKGKYEFNETFNYNGQGVPVGNDIDDAGRIFIRVKSVDIEANTSYLDVTSYYWNPYSDEWREREKGAIKLIGNELVDGTMRTTIIKINSTIMQTHQKDGNGETFITYTRLN